GLPEDKRRAFLFTNVVDGSGRRYDMPVVVGALAASPQIYAIGMGKPIEQIGAAWIDAIAHPIPPVRSNAAPCQEVVITGDELRRADGGLKLLPVPISTPGFDAAPYFTATLCVTRDPESGIQNMGTYRAGLKATDRLGVRMSSRIGGAGGYQHWLKHRKRKTPMPCAIVVGCAPVAAYTGPQKLAIDMDEIGVAGALAGRAIRTVKCVSVDLDVPADAEIVIEGLIDPELLEPEGPFGESHGYIALEDFNMSMQVTAITRKNKPVFVSIISQVTPSESSDIKRVGFEPMLKSFLRDTLGIDSVTGVVMHEPLTNLRPVIFVQFDRPRETEVWRALKGVAAYRSEIGKIVIAVDRDIDPRNLDAVFWALAYRSRPHKDVQILRGQFKAHGPPFNADPESQEDSNLLINATLRGSLPPISLPTKPFMERARVM
ncbi:MAG: UbiD family decarboxylase, partial [Xanthobacteraceae bacterium]